MVQRVPWTRLCQGDRMNSMARLNFALATFFCLFLFGCGEPGAPPRAPVANPSRQLVERELDQEANRFRAGARGRIVPKPRYADKDGWRVYFHDLPLRTFRLVAPKDFDQAVFPPTKVQFISEGLRRVIVRPSGSSHMAFRFTPPEGLVPQRGTRSDNSPIYFPDPDVWIFRDGQVLELEWNSQREAGWIGAAPCFDSSGNRLQVDGFLQLPAGWVGVPSGHKTFRLGIDRAYGPYRQIQPGLWTSTLDPYPLAVELLDALRGSIESKLGPAPRNIEHIIIDSCGACPRGENEPPLAPRGRTDSLVSWIRLGSPGIYLERPGPLQTETLQNWIAATDTDPTGLALANMYAKAIFPIAAPLAGFSFLPVPSFTQTVPEMIRSWRRSSLNWESLALTNDLLPGILFEAREADLEAFDKVIRSMVAKKRAPLWHELVEELRKNAPKTLGPLKARGLVDDQ